MFLGRDPHQLTCVAALVLMPLSAPLLRLLFVLCSDNYLGAQGVMQTLAPSLAKLTQLTTLSVAREWSVFVHCVSAQPCVSL